MRGVVGESLTDDLVARLGVAFARWSGGSPVLVGRDTRASGPELEAALAAGLAAGGSPVTLGGVLPTPAVALLAEGSGAVVSASHNPPEYNGVKLFADGGRKLTDADEREIEALLPDELPTAPTSRAGPRGGAARALRRAPRRALRRSARRAPDRVRHRERRGDGPRAGHARTARRRSSRASATRPTGRTSTSAAERRTRRSCGRPSGAATSTSASRSTGTATGSSPSRPTARRWTATRSWPSSRSTWASSSWS